MRSINPLTHLGHVANFKAFAQVNKVLIATTRIGTDAKGGKHERCERVPVTILDEA